MGVSQLCRKNGQKGQKSVADGSQESEKREKGKASLFLQPEKAKKGRETQQSRGSYQR